MYHEQFVAWLISIERKDKRAERTLAKFSYGPRWRQLELVAHDPEVKALFEDFYRTKISVV